MDAIGVAVIFRLKYTPLVMSRPSSKKQVDPYVDLESQSHTPPQARSSISHTDILQQQDNVLDEMGQRLGTLGSMAQTIQVQVKSSSEDIASLGDDVDDGTSRAIIAQKRINRILRDPSDTRKYICILVLFVVVLSLLAVVIWGPK